jgi:hypothetical protein
LPSEASESSGAVFEAVAFVGTTVGVPLAVGFGTDGLGTVEVSAALGLPVAPAEAGAEPV